MTKITDIQTAIQAVIEQFYGAHLTTAQARKQLHSFIEKNPMKIKVDKGISG